MTRTSWSATRRSRPAGSSAGGRRWRGLPEHLGREHKHPAVACVVPPVLLILRAVLAEPGRQRELLFERVFAAADADAAVPTAVLAGNVEGFDLVGVLGDPESEGIRL